MVTIELDDSELDEIINGLRLLRDHVKYTYSPVSHQDFLSRRQLVRDLQDRLISIRELE